MSSHAIVPFKREFAAAFAELNRAWIERFFRLEHADWKVLRDPEAAIVRPGGQIFFALDQGIPVGTTAVVRVSDVRYELAKMAVAPTQQRQGLGESLGRAALDWVRTTNARTIFLETNSSLTPAIRLYRRLGFVQMSPPSPSEYARADVYMELMLGEPGPHQRR